MGIITWIVFGLLAGFVASMLVNKQGEGLIGDLVLGIIGAMVGGGIAYLLGLQGVINFNPWSFLVAVGGSIVVLAIYHVAIARSQPRI